MDQDNTGDPGAINYALVQDATSGDRYAVLYYHNEICGITGPLTDQECTDIRESPALLADFDYPSVLDEDSDVLWATEQPWQHPLAVWPPDSTRVEPN